MGTVIARLHRALLGCERKVSAYDNSLLEELKGWIFETFEESRWTYISREEYEALVKRLEKWYDRLPVQLIHRDVHFG